MLLGYLFKPRAYSRALCAWYSGLNNDYRFIKISHSAREKYFSYGKKFMQSYWIILNEVHQCLIVFKFWFYF